jgi:hypothetical protein
MSESDTSSSSATSSEGLGSLGDLIDVDEMSDGPAPVVLIDEEGGDIDWSDQSTE